MKVNYVPGTGPGDWVPTPPAYAPAVDPQWGDVTPFALTSSSQFQPPPPPAITSPRYAQEVNQVEMLGGTTSTVRTADQTAIARFWSDLPGTFDPPGHWNQITEIAAITSKTNLENSARAFALVDIALADAGIEAWNVKYAYNTVRPVTVIRDGADGVYPPITADPTWTPLWNTPAFPSYISGHSTFRRRRRGRPHLDLRESLRVHRPRRSDGEPHPAPFHQLQGGRPGSGNEPDLRRNPFHVG